MRIKIRKMIKIRIKIKSRTGLCWETAGQPFQADLHPRLDWLWDPCVRLESLTCDFVAKPQDWPRPAH